MLYRFQSQAAADVLMLEANGKQLLEILGKDPAGRGILLVEQMPAAVAAIHLAIAEEEAEVERNKQEAQEEPGANEIEIEIENEPDLIPLRTRVWPFLEMLNHCQRENAVVVWGV